MKILITGLGLLMAISIQAQDTLSFEACLEKAVENSPRLKDRQIIDDEGSLMVENIKTNWYPSLTLNGKVSYQSDVVSIEIDQSGLPFSFPAMPHEQFGLNLDVRQTLYDGGFSRQKKAYEQASAAAAMQKVDVDLYALKEQVVNLYFTVLILQESRNNLEIALGNLQARENVLQSAVANGIAEVNDLQVIRVEMIRLLQSLSEIDAARNGAIQMLSVYIGNDLGEEVKLLMPKLNIADEDILKRPELGWFDLQSELLEAGKELTAVQRMPKFFAYGQAGVGMPGYNMLNDQVDTYYLVGAGVQWNIWDWNNTSREKQILEKKNQVVQHSKETFAMNLKAGMGKEFQTMEHLKKTIDMDDKMLEMRIDITANAATKLDNGVISASDYLQVMNEENLTRIGKSTHRLQLLKAIANYNLLNGTL